MTPTGANCFVSEGTDWIAGALRHDGGVRKSWRTSLHAKLIVLVALASIFAAPAAFAAPALFEGSGADPGAITTEARNAVLGAGILVAWIALALLLPDFDGRHDEDWGGDQEEWKPF